MPTCIYKVERSASPQDPSEGEFFADPTNAVNSIDFGDDAEKRSEILKGLMGQVHGGLVALITEGTEIPDDVVLAAVHFWVGETHYSIKRIPLSDPPPELVGNTLLSPSRHRH